MPIYVHKNDTQCEYLPGDFVLYHTDWNDWWTYENLYTLKYKETLEVIGIHYFAKAVTECFLHFFQIPILQLPEIDFPACSAVGIGQIEHIPKLIGNIPVD